MHILQNEVEPIRVLAVDATGAGVTGATITIKVRKESDGSYVTATMSETDSTNSPGDYYYNFTGSATGRYSFRATTTHAGIVNDPWAGDLVVDEHVLDSAVTSHKNTGSAGGYLNIMKKYIANKLALTGDRYSVKEDDGSTEFAAGTITTTERTPD